MIKKKQKSTKNKKQKQKTIKKNRQCLYYSFWIYIYIFYHVSLTFYCDSQIINNWQNLSTKTDYKYWHRFIIIFFMRKIS